MAEKKIRPASDDEQGEPKMDTYHNVEFLDSPLEDVSDMADEAVLVDEVGDPDLSVLSQQEEENLEEDLLDIKNPHIAAELSEDPVRLYLREIGEVKLLDSDSEFRLATMIEADRWVKTLQRRPLRKGVTLACAIYHGLITEMVTAWARLLEDTERLHVEPPVFSQVIIETQALHSSWQSNTPSYLRAYLDNGRWGTDELWNGIANNAYRVFLSLYLLPFSYTEWLLNHLTHDHPLPTQQTLYHNLPSDEDLLVEIKSVQTRAVDARCKFVNATG